MGKSRVIEEKTLKSYCKKKRIKEMHSYNDDYDDESVYNSILSRKKVANIK